MNLGSSIGNLLTMNVLCLLMVFLLFYGLFIDLI